ncbi:UNVERIFIED_CONTAM: hypothetical protein GTU68_020167 [Idotea baltica]|nr:hypothetical protein [Idotea baltica]
MNHQPRKRFGQNFLNDNLVIDRIVDAINPQPAQRVVEVGPGLGAITQPLLDRLDHLQVIEIDRDLIAKLHARNNPKLTVHEADVLTINWETIANDEPLRIVGNLPYNIGTPLLLNLLNQRLHIQDIHVMLQKEVIDRLCASVGSRAYGRLSVMMQSCFAIEHLFDVPPNSFTPPPKVQSAVARITPLDSSPDEHTLKKLALASRTAFAKKRKTLRNNMKETLSAEQLIDAGLDPQARAETLSLDQFLLLAKMLP